MILPDLYWPKEGQPVITAYTVMTLAGVLVTLFYMMHFSKKQGYDEYRVLFLELIAFCGAFFGGHLLGALIERESVAEFFRKTGSFSSVAEFKTLFNRAFGTSVFYGGLILALILAAIYICKTEKVRAPYFDMTAVGIPLFHFFGRLGCFFTGCCYGVPWEYGVGYLHPLTAAQPGVPLVPVQLIEAVLNLLLFFVLRRLFVQKKLGGKLLLLYLLVYPSYRFLLEFLRGDRIRGFVGALSTSQFISLALIAFALVWWLFSRRKAPKAADAVSE